MFEVRTSLPLHPYYSISLLDAGGKPSTLFPPGGLVKLTATPAQVNRCKKKHANKRRRNIAAREYYYPGNIFNQKSKSKLILSRPPEPLRNNPEVSR